MFAVGLVLAVLTIGGCGDETASADRSTMNTTTTSTTTTATTTAFTPTPAEPVYVAPFIDRVEWAATEQGPSLQVFPTDAGRYVLGETELDPAWAEVVALEPTADSPGMREQFACHWRFARIVAPDKTSWNLEPWRPVVTDQEMIASRCNPGGAEEQIP
ncbi:DUF2599 domain-containing protein [Williamsia sp. 1135]|uniref:DUF2599 domain-containing protein n=1 Tax=Williamsia sp. 1135 TaxID=1889262 RepID=UPI001F0B5AE1|nr:DUF2599 domain-containing protein [Williamsia sp. 1135]